MNPVITGLLGRDVDVIIAFANNDMNYTRTARELDIDHRTVYRRLDSVHKRSKLNPHRFRDLVRLVQIIEDDDD